MPINPAFIDVDFARQPQFVRGDLGMPATMPTFADYADGAELIPESQWRELAELQAKDQNGTDALVTRIYNQGNEGSCVANACAQAHEIMQARQFGKSRVRPLSAMSLYQFIGSSPNSGAMVSDGMEEGAAKGFLPLDTPENRAIFGDKVMPNTGWRTKRPGGWEPVAQQFRYLEWRVHRSVNSLMTALFKREPVVVGRAGHSICYCRPVWDGRWLVRYANSWGDWGEDGYGYDSWNYVRNSSGWAFSPVSVVDHTHYGSAA